MLQLQLYSLYCQTSKILELQIGHQCHDTFLDTQFALYIQVILYRRRGKTHYYDDMCNLIPLLIQFKPPTTKLPWTFTLLFHKTVTIFHAFDQENCHRIIS